MRLANLSLLNQSLSVVNWQTHFNLDEITELKTAKSLLAVSGGSDSVYLFYLFCQLKEQFAIHFEVIHFNHGLRGSESDAEEKFVKNLCDQHHIICHVESFQFAHKSSVQQLARQKRQDVFFDMQLKYYFTHVFLAHHQDDFLETIIMKSVRGSGIKGYSGIAKKNILSNRFSPHQKICVWRPLLKISKDHILLWLQQNNKIFCTDSSNNSSQYFRNRVRFLLQEKNITPSDKQKIFTSAQVLQECSNYFSARANFVLQKTRHFLSQELMNSLTSEITFLVLQKMLFKHGFKKQFESHHYKSIVNLGLERVLLLGLAKIARDKSGFYFTNQNIKPHSFLPQKKINHSGSFYFGQLNLIISIQLYKNKKISTAELKNSNALCLTAQTPFPLILCLANSDDHFYPFGKNHVVSLNEYFTAQKIPKYARKFWPVLKTLAGEIVAVLYLGVSQNYKVSSNENSFFKIRTRNL